MQACDRSNSLAGRASVSKLRKTPGGGHRRQQAEDITYPTAGGTQAIRIYTPGRANGPLPVTVHIHGGGHVIAKLDTYESSAMTLAKKTGAVVASVEYRHAPDFLFPAAHDDTFDAYKWLLEKAAKFDGDPKRVVIDVAIRPRS